MELGVAIDFENEIDARRAVQLANDHALGAIDDELAAADHDRHIAEINFFFNDRTIRLAQRSQTLKGRP